MQYLPYPLGIGYKVYAYNNHIIFICQHYNFVKKYRFLYIFIIYNNNFRLYFHFFIYFTLFLSNFLYFLKKLDYIFLLILSSSYIIYYNYICINFVVFIIKYIIL